MAESLELLIVIINYKTADLIIDCINSVTPQLEKKQHIVVVDNFSNDGSAEKIADWVAENGGDRIHMVFSDVNGGFSAGNNLGLKYADADYYLLLNSDALLRDGALQAMLTTFRDEGSRELGFVAPRLEWPDGKPQESCFRFHSPLSELLNASNTGWVTRLLQRWEVAFRVSDTPMTPEWASFACIMLRGEMVKDVGLMDEGYFLYYEDADYCKMAKLNNWHVLYQPEARVVHLRGGSSPVKSNTRLKKRLPKYYYASRARFFAKHYGIVGLGLANMLWYVGRCISKSRELLGRQYVTACEKQYRDIWTRFSMPLKPFRPE
ncbi:hypothetical protein P886_0638 [Alteromonadaceae bacterium 2753L.S.0a.02]|nr:hypothetical protein P886_0638 [Alteromonadaceae bacterium 2753L.S.0a.02]